MGILDPPVVGIVDHDDLLSNVRHASAFGADQRDGVQAILFGPFQGFDAIGRIAADTQAHGYVAGLGVILKLPHKDIFVRIIVGQRQHPAHVIVE